MICRSVDRIRVRAYQISPQSTFAHETSKSYPLLARVSPSPRRQPDSRVLLRPPRRIAFALLPGGHTNSSPQLTTSTVSSFRRAMITTSPHLGLAKVIRSLRRMSFAALTKPHWNRCKFLRLVAKYFLVLLSNYNSARCDCRANY
jgi:hypothetical protein